MLRARRLRNLAPVARSESGACHFAQPSKSTDSGKLRALWPSAPEIKPVRAPMTRHGVVAEEGGRSENNRGGGGSSAACRVGIEKPGSLRVNEAAALPRAARKSV